MRSAGAAAQGSTAYLNLEPGDSHADMASVSALAGCGVSRVVIGLLQPLQHLRGQAVRALRAAGVAVSVLEPGSAAAQSQAGQRCLQACMLVNEVRTCNSLNSASDHSLFPIHADTRCAVHGRPACWSMRCGPACREGCLLRSKVSLVKVLCGWCQEAAVCGKQAGTMSAALKAP